MALPGFPFGNKRPNQAITYDAQLKGGLATVVTASRSLVSFFLNMTPGEEFVVTNMAWVMLSCGMSLAVRLDVLLKDPRIEPFAEHIGLFLDIRHSMRQLILRLESATAIYSSNDGSTENTFRQFLTRARAIESWHGNQLSISPAMSMPGPRVPESAATGSTSSTSNYETDGGVTSGGFDIGLNTLLPNLGDATADPLNDFDPTVLDILFDGHTPLFNPNMFNL